MAGRAASADKRAAADKGDKEARVQATSTILFRSGARHGARCNPRHGARRNLRHGARRNPRDPPRLRDSSTTCRSIRNSGDDGMVVRMVFVFVARVFVVATVFVMVTTPFVLAMRVTCALGFPSRCLSRYPQRICR